MITVTIGVVSLVRFDYSWIMIPIFLLLRCCCLGCIKPWYESFCCYERHQHPSSEPSSTVLLNESREDRRERILANIIHKKVIKRPKLKSQDYGIKSRPNMENCDDRDGEEDPSCNCILVLPPENDLSSRLDALMSDAEEGTMVDPKNDIYVESLRSIRDSLRIPAVPVTAATDETQSSLYSPQTCPVCCEDYQKGDEIAWSKNEKCPHAYHVDCILEWLMKHDDCPMCREQYVT